MFLRHPILSTLTLAYLGVVAWVTLGPQPFDAGTDSLVWRILSALDRLPFASGIGYSDLEFAANVAMFVPLGLFFLLLLGRRHWFSAIVLGVLLTVVIEVVQLALPGRVTDIRDIVANSAGAAAGVFLALLLTWAKARRLRREARQRVSTRPIPVH